MPRNRSVRLAALGASAQRTAPSSFGSRAGASVRRRAVVVALVALSLVLITGYFRESESGFFHDVQSTAAQALEPFEIAAERLSRPFANAWGWFDGLRDAKSERDRLAAELDAALAQVQRAQAAPSVEGLGAAAKNAPAPTLAKDFNLLRTEVLFENTGFAQEIVVSAGSDDGIRMYDPVVATGKSALLVGHVSKVADSTARVTLVTDTESAVAAYDLTSSAKGVVRGRGAGDADTCVRSRPQAGRRLPG